jgi:hypothetical protein
MLDRAEAGAVPRKKRTVVFPVMRSIAREAANM